MILIQTMKTGKYLNIFLIFCECLFTKIFFRSSDSSSASSGSSSINSNDSVESVVSVSKKEETKDVTTVLKISPAPSIKVSIFQN